MRFETFAPSDALKPYIKQFVISENGGESTYKVFPSTGLVAGFQYRGQMQLVNGTHTSQLDRSGITGLSDTFRTFKSSAGIGTVLVYFTETGLAYFSECPANELFNLSVSLDDIFDKSKVAETEEKLAIALTDQQRVKVMERFLLAHLIDVRRDQVVINAVKLIYDSKGTIRITELLEKLSISQSPLEKRFRKIVGTSPKRFASVVRFNSVLETINTSKSLTDICYENNFFDQSHFIRDFRQYTGSSPEDFRKSY